MFRERVSHPCSTRPDSREICRGQLLREAGLEANPPLPRGLRVVSIARGAVSLVVGLLVAGQSSGLFRLTSLTYRSLFVGLAFLLLFSASFRVDQRWPRARAAALGVVIVLLLAATLYTVLSADRLMAAQEEPTGADHIVGAFFLLASLEAGRRQIGLSFVGIVLASLAYLYAGPYLPGVLANAGMGLMDIVDHLYVGTNGIWGSLTGIVTLLVAMYIIFGQIMLGSGASEFFIQFAQAAAGRTSAGPASATIFISGTFGMLSGSSAANAATFGTFTIPLMRRSGYTRETAAAVEAVASTGGQVMPPVMGAAAFIMAEFLDVPYVQIAIAATVPAVLYYFGAWAYINARAKAFGGVRVDTGLSVVEVIRREWRSMAKLVTAFGMLTYLLLAGKSPQYAAFWTTAGVLAVVAVLDWRKPAHVLATFTQVRNSLMSAVPALTDVAALGVCSQVIVFMIGITGLAPKLTNIVIDISGGRLLTGLTLTAIVTTFLGMGVATTADYVIASAALAPALIAMGADPLAVHLFIFYFAASSSLTPPVCASVFVASSIAGSRIWSTGGRACVMAISAFVVPFLFVYHPQLLFRGAPLDIVLSVLVVGVSIYAVSAGLGGAVRRRLRWLERAVVLAGGILLWQANPLVSLVGLLGVAGIFAVQLWQRPDVAAIARSSEGSEGVPK